MALQANKQIFDNLMARHHRRWKRIWFQNGVIILVSMLLGLNAIFQFEYLSLIWWILFIATLIMAAMSIYCFWRAWQSIRGLW